MPPLDIIDDDGNLKQLAPITVGAVMLSPTDEKRGEEIYATGYLDTATKVKQGIPFEIGAVIDSGPGKPAILRNAKFQGYDGWLAGQVLLFILRCAAHQPQDASIGKAVYVMERALVLLKNQQGRPVSASRTKITNAWGKFKTVSHLWAAEHISCPIYALNPDNLLEFLATAECFRNHAEAHVPPPRRAKAAPLFAEGEAWAAPDRLELTTIPFAPPSLSPNELEWLTEYKAEYKAD